MGEMANGYSWNSRIIYKSNIFNKDISTVCPLFSIVIWLALPRNLACKCTQFFEMLPIIEGECNGYSWSYYKGMAWKGWLGISQIFELSLFFLHIMVYLQHGRVNLMVIEKAIPT